MHDCYENDCYLHLIHSQISQNTQWEVDRAMNPESACWLLSTEMVVHILIRQGTFVKAGASDNKILNTFFPAHPLEAGSLGRSLLLVSLSRPYARAMNAPLRVDVKILR